MSCLACRGTGQVAIAYWSFDVGEFVKAEPCPTCSPGVARDRISSVDPALDLPVWLCDVCGNTPSTHGAMCQDCALTFV